MNSNKAKLKYHANSFDIVENGDHTICAVSGKKYHLMNLLIGT